ncbi:unnamed protein product [Ceratitis capitata]|uniref:(Mediterranean fruit fly) hypothetical protein n=1 Tax=Ceratitis capitata TaxID=7213 RepID=A0A811UC61_CERCA|nr:unnamed protein product [Ceratitis capitata]
MAGGDKASVAHGSTGKERAPEHSIRAGCTPKGRMQRDKCKGKKVHAKHTRAHTRTQPHTSSCACVAVRWFLITKATRVLCRLPFTD